MTSRETRPAAKGTPWLFTLAISVFPGIIQLVD